MSYCCSLHLEIDYRIERFAKSYDGESVPYIRAETLYS